MQDHEPARHRCLARTYDHSCACRFCKGHLCDTGSGASMGFFGGEASGASAAASCAAESTSCPSATSRMLDERPMKYPPPMTALTDTTSKNDLTSGWRNELSRSSIGRPCDLRECIS